MVSIKNKRGQFIIFSGMFLLLLLLFIYSLETQNTYIIEPAKFRLLDNIIYESCMIGKLSNGSFIDSRFDNFTLNVASYCNIFGNFCNLTIVKIDGAPTNLSLLNYTHYNYSLEYNYDDNYYNERFNC